MRRRRQHDHRRRGRLERLCGTRPARRRRELPPPLRPLHRRRVRRTHQGRLLREHLAGQRQAVHRGRPRHRRRHRPCRGCRVAGLRVVEEDHGHRPRQHPQQDRRPHRGEPRGHRRRRDLGQRQARARDPRRRHPARRRPLPLLRRRAACAGGLAEPDRRRHRRVPLPRAARRRRTDHPVELPDPHGHVEARAGPRGRKLRRAEARRADPGVDPVPLRHHRRPAAGRCRQHRQRVRHRGRRAARAAQAHPQGRVHG